MEELLRVCTTETPFKLPNGQLYQQIDGISMGSRLGPLFASFYMCNLENRVLNELGPNDKPTVYCRYVDDIFLIVPNILSLQLIKTKFELNSVLKFTTELECRTNLAFIDTIVTKSLGNISTDVHMKPTYTGECINFYSVAPDRYKSGVINTMLNRSYKICSDHNSFNNEVDRLHKLFTNNNFPNKLITREIDKFKTKITQQSHPNLDDSSRPHTTNLFFKAQMSSQYKQEEGNLKRIIDNNLSPTTGNDICLKIYYKNRKFRDLFIRNKPPSAEVSQ